MNKTRTTDRTETYWSKYGSLPPYIVNGQTAAVFTESFSDSGRHRVDNTCRHVKYTSDYDYLIQGLFYPNRPDLIGLQWGLGYRVSSLGFLGYPLLIPYQPPAINLHNLSADAFTAMRPTMTNKLSLTNFILELGDLKQLFRLWDTHKSVITNAAAGHLNYSFGWRPLLSDLKKIFQYIGQYEMKLHDLISRAESPQVRRFRTNVTGTDVESYAYDEPWSGHQFKLHTAYSNITFCAKMCFAYSLPKYRWSELNCRAALDALGLNVNPAQIWDAIPFSFLVDWFTNIGTVLEQFNNNWLEPILSVRSMMYSVLTEGTTKTYAFPWYRQYPEQSVHWELCSQHEFTHYTRSWGLPVIDHQLELSYPATFGKIALGASLFQTLRR